jgi:Family of unknown function (DUF6326)
MNKLKESPVNVRIKLSGLWTAMLFVFAYVDIFSLYRPDFREDIAMDKIAGFDINQTFLFFTTLYILIPSLMVYLNLVMKPKISRIANIVLASFYALTIIAGAIGEWTYYVIGSIVELGLLTTIVATARNWPKQ